MSIRSQRKKQAEKERVCFEVEVCTTIPLKLERICAKAEFKARANLVRTSFSIPLRLSAAPTKSGSTRFILEAGIIMRTHKIHRDNQKKSSASVVTDPCRTRRLGSSSPQSLCTIYAVDQKRPGHCLCILPGSFRQMAMQTRGEYMQESRKARWKV